MSPRSQGHGVPVTVKAPEEAPEESAQPENSGEFEIVLGKRQVAGVLFVTTVVLVAFSAVSYLAGKALSPVPARKAEPEPITLAPVPVVAAVIPATPAPPTPADPPVPPAQPIHVAKSDAPLFSEPKPGATYLQMGAVEKGIAIIFAEGLRAHGLDAFVAPGPNEKIFRVLIGPMADPKAYERAKNTVDQIGLSTFGHKYE